MIEHETHSLLVTVDSLDPFAESLHQVIEGFIQDVRQDGSFQMSPQAFDQVQTGTVGRQPENFDAVSVGRQPLLHRLGVVESSIVAHQVAKP